MTPRLNTGMGVTGAVRYVLNQVEGRRDGTTGAFQPEETSRVDWISGQGFCFTINSREDAELARRVMEFDALNQASKTRRCEKDCVHISLSWRPGENPSRKEMEDAAREALKSLGMENAKALFVAHNDEDYSHVHIVASKINPATGRAYDLERSKIKLSDWALEHERQHGGVISLRREDAHGLRSAIGSRDAGAVLDALTKQHSTLTEKQIYRELEKEIIRPGRHGADRVRDECELAGFHRTIMARPELVALSITPDGPTVRYTTRAVLEAELHVLRSADGLAADTRHGISEGARGAALKDERFKNISPEQTRAYQHATGKEGLAIIDGQAGTGKSFTLAAVRATYEKAGYRVVGLAPTNAVAEDMRGDGFGYARTVHSELFALNNDRTSWNRRTVVIVDEAAMLDTKLMAMITAHAHDAGAKLILAGDDRQLSSIDRGGMFGALKDRHGAAVLSEVKRQHKLDDRRAAEMMARGNFHDALNIYDQKGAIHWTRTQGQARDALVDQWAKDSAASPDKSRFVFAYTNDDVNRLNAALREVRQRRGELGQDHHLTTAHGRAAFATGDRIQFTGTDKKAGIVNGNAGVIDKIDGSRITVKLDGKKSQTLTFDAGEFLQFRHGYAGTIYRGQGRTLDQTYLYHSEHWRSASSYVALTRHREKTEIFVARNTLDIKRSGSPEAGSPEIRALARQMARVDDRRAASMFYHRADLGPSRPLTAKEILARFGHDRIKPERQRPAVSDDQTRIDQAAEQAMREARQAAKGRRDDVRGETSDADREINDRRQRHENDLQDETPDDEVRYDRWTGERLGQHRDGGRGRRRTR